MTETDEGAVRAGGGVLWRRGTERPSVEICVIHRPRYDDWSLPKGKVDPGETDAEAARREVVEETGFTVVLGPEVATTRYRDRKDRPKQVRYWVMALADGQSGEGFVVNEEVDILEWLTADAARERLTWDRDRTVIDDARAYLEQAATEG